MDMWVSCKLIVEEYGAYSKLEAFWQGYGDYVAGRLGREPYPADSVDGQAYDRGLEAAMRTRRKVERAGLSWAQLPGGLLQ
jgi:hypothetical protein